MFQGTSYSVEPSAFIVTLDALQRRFNQVEKGELGLALRKASEVKRRGVRRLPYLSWDGEGATCLQVLGKTELISKFFCV